MTSCSLRSLVLRCSCGCSKDFFVCVYFIFFGRKSNFVLPTFVIFWTFSSILFYCNCVRSLWFSSSFSFFSDLSLFFFIALVALSPSLFLSLGILHSPQRSSQGRALCPSRNKRTRSFLSEFPRPAFFCGPVKKAVLWGLRRSLDVLRAKDWWGSLLRFQMRTGEDPCCVKR